MPKITGLSLLFLALSAPAWAAGDVDLLNQAGQTPGPGVIRDTGGQRVGTMERSGDGWTVRDQTGRRVGTVENR